MKDSYGREIDYFRVSVTDRCNLRCLYCMPKGAECSRNKDILNDEEIVLICKAAARTGIKNIRITGGEPLLRAGIPGLIRRIADIEGIEKISMTTNGILLAENAKELAAAGLYGVNVSLDTLDDENYKRITGFGSNMDKTGNETENEIETGNETETGNESEIGNGIVSRILEGVDISISAGLKVKINSVLTKINEHDQTDLVELARDRDVCVRFIEVMPIGNGKEITGVSNIELINMIEKKYGKMNRFRGNFGPGPAEYHKIDGFMGYIGFISAIHKKFCDSCNRIRLTSSGILKPCLCYDSKTDLHAMIMRGADATELENAIKYAILNKPEAHCFEKPEMISESGNMVQIGG
ncbi:MAG: GTP 3',8-cyclase MoaA [Lachnospiraceae bacterium]|nr:GTP 3',8-cyclase MoaA [Lachnospiraceae bacterium]